MGAGEHGRKPGGVSWEAWTERQIRDGIARGEFDDLPGAGRPLEGLEHPHDEDWWIKAKLRREELSYLPPTLAIRREVELAREAIRAASSETVVRRILDEINPRIREMNRLGAAGPPTSVMPFDVDATVAAWRRERAGPPGDVTPP